MASRKSAPATTETLPVIDPAPDAGAPPVTEPVAEQTPAPATEPAPDAPPAETVDPAPEDANDAEEVAAAPEEVAGDAIATQNVPFAVLVAEAARHAMRAEDAPKHGALENFLVHVGRLKAAFSEVDGMLEGDAAVMADKIKALL